MREKNPHRGLPVLAGLVAIMMAGCTPDNSSSEPEGKTASPDGEVAAETDKADAVVPDAAAVDAAAKDLASGPVGGARAIDVEYDDYTFHYAYPAQAGQIPELKAQLDADAEKKRTTLAKETAEFRVEAEKDGFPFRPYAQSTDWAVVTDLPNWLSLSAEIYAFTGGAHGNTTFDSLLWDKQAGQQRKLMSLFTSSATLAKAVQPALCDALDRARAKKRGKKIVRDQSDWMSACIGLEDTIPILGSSSGKAFDRIGFLIPPYAAGPYAEGSYEVTLPITSAILRAVKPEFKESFATGR